MENRYVEFNVGAETGTQPDPGTPTLPGDLIPLNYLQAEYTQKRKVTGSWASPQAIVAGTGVAFTGSERLQTWYIQGSGGAVNITANPQIAAGTEVGQRLTLICVSSTNTVTVEHGTGITMNGTRVLGEGSSIEFEWGGATPGWIEVGGNGIEA